MEKDLVKVALRCGALYLQPDRAPVVPNDPDCPDLLSAATVHTLEELMTHGYTVDEKALRMLNRLTPEDQAEIMEVMKDVYGTELNWMPLVKNWQEPTGTDWSTHLYVGFYNYICNHLGINDAEGVRLPCGHIIPPGTFDLERYNGCPYCGVPFRTADFVIHNAPTKLKTLKGWDEDDIYTYYKDLLESKTPLDATQRDSLKLLLDAFHVPDGIDIIIKETIAEVTLRFLDDNMIESALQYLKTPADLLRMLWYAITGKAQVISPATLVRSAWKNGHNLCPALEASADSATAMADALRLHYTRRDCRVAATLLNRMDIDPAKACETMHPNRGMWVRFIRALRLAEYARKPGYERLHQIIDRFYRGDYEVLQGEVDKAMAQHRYRTAVDLLSTRPGVFARELFNQMLTTDPAAVLAEFAKVAPKLPLRLLYSLASNAETYFLNDTGQRSIRTITGITVDVPANSRLQRYDRDKLNDMVKGVMSLILSNLAAEYAKKPEPGKKIYISPALYRVALPIGDRATSMAGAMAVPQGSAFPLSGDKVRVFLQWGKGMKAQYLDLDLSAVAVYIDKVEQCAYYNLTTTGMQHSGDMRAIPDDVGTAEYVEVDVNALDEAGAKYVLFTMNAYSNGAITPNTMAGWMDSANEMKVDNDTGVAYDPACVEYLIKIDDNNISKGLVFAVLDVKAREMIWLEMAFDGQNVQSLSVSTVLGLLRKISNKVSIGKALEVMAEARGMVQVGKDEITDDTDVYTREWAYDAAAVAKLLLG